MQQRFDEWLEEKLGERGWQAADLARASKQPDYPRGFDPGLISRWRKPPPIGVVPTRPTLDRIARALGVSRSSAYVAAGLQPPVDEQARPTEALVRSELDARLARLATTLSQYPRVFWLAVVEASERMATAGEALHAAPPVSATSEERISAADQAIARPHHAKDEGLAKSSRAPLLAAAW